MSNLQPFAPMTDTATLQRCLTYLETQVGPQKSRSPHALRPPTITLSRMAGTGGTKLASQLAAYLQAHHPATPAPWTIFNRSLVEKVLAEHQLPSQLSRYMPENRVSYIEDTLGELLGLHPSTTSLVTQTTETILGLAELGNCIIVGRGANVILANCPTAFHVRLVGSPAKCAERLMADRQIPEAEAQAQLRNEDAARRRYLKTNFDADISDPLAYHLVLNTDSIPIEEAAEIVGHAVLKHFSSGN